jgi:glycosyltransferase involved in cell wall biosynthesis
MSVTLISIVVPTHNEMRNVETLYRRVAAVFDSLPTCDFELIFSDDSDDDTPREIGRLHQLDARVKLVRLSRRFSQAVAITAGIDRCKGSAAILMDADLQDPPEVIPRLLQLWEAGNEVVYVERRSASDYAAYRLFSGIFYRLLQRLASVDIPLDAGEFRLLDRKVIDFLRRLTEHTRYMRGLTVWPGLRRASVRIERAPRSQGRTNYSFGRSLLVAVDGMVSFSVVPLRLATIIGSFVAAGSLLLGLIYAVLKIFHSTAFGTGWTSLIVSIFFLAGVQLIFLGIVGEYVGRVFLEVQNRPVYLVDYELGFSEALAAASEHAQESKS